MGLWRKLFGLLGDSDSGLVRDEYWPGHPPTIQTGRVMCSDCRFRREAMAGWTYDRCTHPKADHGNIVRNETPKCCDMRYSSAQCGKAGRWFEPLKTGAKS